MKKIYKIFELLTDILDCVRSISRTLTNDRVSSPAEKVISNFVASNSLELQSLFREISETPAPPIMLGEYYVVKVSKRSF